MVKVPQLKKKSNHKDEITRALSNALRDVFGEGIDKNRFVDVERIPLLCKSVIEIREDISEIKNNQIGLQQAIQTIGIKDTDQEIEAEKKRKFWDKIRWKVIESVITATIIIIVLVLQRTGILNLFK